MDLEPVTAALTNDRPCPVGFVVVPAFIGALVWLCVLLHAVP